jgi:hypothetical protein
MPADQPKVLEDLGSTKVRFCLWKWHADRQVNPADESQCESDLEEA